MLVSREIRKGKRNREKDHSVWLLLCKNIHFCVIGRNFFKQSYFAWRLNILQDHVTSFNRFCSCLQQNTVIRWNWTILQIWCKKLFNPNIRLYSISVLYGPISSSNGYNFVILTRASGLQKGNFNFVLQNLGPILTSVIYKQSY